MAWLELKIDTIPSSIDDVAAALTAGGFADLVIEDQQEFESFLDENRAYWDYIDETLQDQLQGLSCIKLYLEDSDVAGLSRLDKLLYPIKTIYSAEARKKIRLVLEDFQPDVVHLNNIQFHLHQIEYDL